MKPRLDDPTARSGAAARIGLLARSRVRVVTAAVGLTVATTVACGPSSPGPQAPAPGPSSGWAPSPSPEPQVYSIPLAGEPAAVYDSDAGTVSPLSTAVSNRYAGLEASPCLERAARGHTDLPAGFERQLPLAFTEFALHWAGCPDPTAALSVLLTNQPGPEPVITELGRVLEGGSYSHIGVAASPAPPPYTTRWFVLLVERRMAMKPVPTSVDPGSSLALQFRVDAQFERSTIAVTRPRGTTETIEAGTGGGWAVAGIDVADEIGRQWIELIGHGPSGPRVLALFPVEVGRRPPRQWIGHPVADESWIDSTGEAEAFAARLVKEDRSRFGLEALSLDPRLVEIARSHSAEMADRGFFAHVSPSTGTVADRLTAAGYPALLAAENIAMAPTLTEAQESLMRSPGHRAAVLTTEATHFGVGVVTRDDPQRGRVRHVTQVYVRRPPDP